MKIIIRKILPFMDLVGLNRPLKTIMQEHLDIVSAMHQRDEEKAVRSIAVHLENSKRSHL